MIMSTPVERKNLTALFKNERSSSTERSRSKGTTSTWKRTMRIASFRITVYGRMHRRFPASSVPPIHPYSSLTVRRNGSEAYTGRPLCHLISTGFAFRLFTFFRPSSPPYSVPGVAIGESRFPQAPRVPSVLIRDTPARSASPSTVHGSYCTRFLKSRPTASGRVTEYLSRARGPPMMHGLSSLKQNLAGKPLAEDPQTLVSESGSRGSSLARTGNRRAVFLRLPYRRYSPCRDGQSRTRARYGYPSSEAVTPEPCAKQCVLC